MSETLSLPNGYRSLQPYLIFQNCGAAIDFYKVAFDATERMRMETPERGIGHAELQIGDSVLMMADETSADHARSPARFGGSPVSLVLYTANCDETYAQALRCGAKSLREPADQPYGDRMSGVADPFGYSWWIATPLKDVAQYR